MKRKFTEDDILINLNKHFNYKTLRPGQLSIIKNILEDKDVLISKESGFGKSLCFQLPGLMRDGLMIIISPYVSRMENKSLELSLLKNINCACLSSNTSCHESQNNYQDLRSILIRKNKVLDDLRNLDNTKLKFLYVSLEYFLCSARLRDILRDIYEKHLLQAIVIDEIQHVTQWSYLFKRDYWSLGNLKDLYPNLPFLCFTGPMNKKSLTIIHETLHLKDPYKLNEPSAKHNLSYKVMYTENVFSNSKLVDFVKAMYSNKSGIIYCRNKNQCQDLAKELQDNNIRSVCYLSTQTDTDRSWLHWMNSCSIVVVCVTGSYLDINLHKVEFVIHMSIPCSLDIYIQESETINNHCYGDCIMFYNKTDCDVNLRYMAEMYKEKIRRSISRKLELSIELKDHLRDIFDVIIYTENISVCRQNFLLTYFNEQNVILPCQVCDVCKIMQNAFVIDIAYVLRKILMVIWTINKYQKYHMNEKKFFYASIDCVINLLLGSSDKHFANPRMMYEWFFGSFGTWDKKLLHRFIFILLSNKFTTANHVINDEYEVFENLIITPKGQEFIKSNNEFNIKFSRKDSSFTKWLNVDWIKKQFRKDLENIVLFHSIHNNKKMSDYLSYIENLFNDVPTTWENFKNIKSKYIQSNKDDLDEDLFIICTIYNQILRKLNNGSN